MPRERWIERAQARARSLRDAARAARDRSAGPASMPPVETDADPDGEEDRPLEEPAPAPEPIAEQVDAPAPVAAGPGSEATQLALETDVPGEPATPTDPHPRAEPELSELDAEHAPDPEPHPGQTRLDSGMYSRGGRFAGAGERVAGLGYEARGALSDARHWTSERWRATPLIARQRIGAAAIVVAVLAIVAFVLVPAAPCSFPGGDSCPPPDDAIDLVPADALAYAHVDIGSESDQFAAAQDLADRLPLLSGLVTRPLSRVGGASIDLATDVEPWAGSEAAFAMLPQGVRGASVTLIEVDDPDGADQFVSGLLGPAPRESDAGGVEVSVGLRGQAAAQVEGFLVLGDEDAVTSVVDPPDDAMKLETSAAGAAIDELPDDRLAYAYLSGTGARALLARPSLRALDTFVDSSATGGVAAALSVDDGAAKVTVRSHLDPDRAESAPGFFSALPLFTPSLAADVGPDALAYLGLGEPGNGVQSLLSQASTEAPELRRAYVQAAQQLRKGGGINVAGDLLPLLGDQVALSVEPVSAAAPETPGVVGTPGVPYVSLLADGVDSEAAAADLALLQQPLTDALVPKSGEVGGRVSRFESVQIAGVDAQTLPVSRNVTLTYATYDDRLAIATDPLGIAQARAGGDGLADTDTFKRVTDGFPEEVSLIAYLDLRDLIALGEQIGLAADPGYAALAPDLRALDAAAVAVTDEDGVIRTDATLALGDPEDAAVDSPPTPAE